MSNKIFRMTLDLPVEDHKKLKTIAALQGKPMRAVIIEALDLFYTREKDTSHMPNAQTRKVLDEIEAGKGLVKCKNLEDLFKKLGI